MPRPRKWRKVCCLPDSDRFGPLNASVNTDHIIMTVEEYEAIRLIDLEGFTQENMGDNMLLQPFGIYSDQKKAGGVYHGRYEDWGKHKLCEDVCHPVKAGSCQATV